MKTGDFYGTIEDDGKTYIVEISVKELKDLAETIRKKEFQDFANEMTTFLGKRIKELS